MAICNFKQCQVSILGRLSTEKGIHRGASYQDPEPLFLRRLNKDPYFSGESEDGTTLFFTGPIRIQIRNTAINSIWVVISVEIPH